MKFTLNKDTELTTSLLKKFIEKNRTEVARLQKLEDYYCGKHDILSRTVEDKSKPNHKIVHPYAQYITDTLCGYFVGEPITYSSNDENAHNELAAILNDNNYSSEDMELARNASIYGKAYELHYLDEESNPKFTYLNPEDVIIIYDDTIAANILYAIRIIPLYNIENNKTEYKIEVYTDTEVRFYDANENLTSFSPSGKPEPHFYGMVPIVEIKNNNYCMGDFETIIPLIDAYDTLESDALNDFDYFVNAYLTLTGVNADSEDIQAMKENRVIILDDVNSKAEWLIKSESDTVSENLKNRFNNDIHKFSKTPDLSDENFSANASGIAIKYKLYGTESLVSNKENYFKKGLQRRIELIFAVLGIKGSAYDWRAIDIQFTRNVPTNETEIADVVQKLSGIVSTETLLAQIPFVSDVKAELEKLEADKERNPFYNLEKELETEE